MPWVFDPHSGGVKIPTSMYHSLAAQAAGEVDTPLRCGTLAWQFVQLQAALPASCVRQRRWPAYAVASAPSSDAPPPPPPSAQDLARASLAALGATSGPSSRREAGRLLSGPLGDPEEGVAALCEGGAWLEAASTAAAAARLDLVDTVLLPSLADAAAAVVADLRGRQEELCEAWGRLVQVGTVGVVMPARVTRVLRFDIHVLATCFLPALLPRLAHYCLPLCRCAPSALRFRCRSS